MHLVPCTFQHAGILCRTTMHFTIHTWEQHLYMLSYYKTSGSRLNAFRSRSLSPLSFAAHHQIIHCSLTCLSDTVTRQKEGRRSRTPNSDLFDGMTSVQHVFDPEIIDRPTPSNIQIFEVLAFDQRIQCFERHFPPTEEAQPLYSLA